MWSSTSLRGIVRTNIYIYISIALICAAIGLYFNYFSAYDVSDSPEQWGQLGDYFGGIVNPLLSFISILLIVRSLQLQKSANDMLLREMKESRRWEEFRSFEAKFFNMIRVQSESFAALCFETPERVQVRCADAVIWLEGELEQLRAVEGTDSDLADLIDEWDSRDQLFGILRGFYATVKFVIEGLSDEKGFCRKDRLESIRVLMNFTEFSAMRVVKMMCQFSDAHAAGYLNGCPEFQLVVEEMGMNSVRY